MTITDAMETVEKFDAMPYFDRVKDKARLNIAEMLLALIGQKDLRYGSVVVGYDERNREIAEGGEILTPLDRLKWVEAAMIQDVGAWPKDGGFAEIRAFYCAFFAPGDGIEPKGYSELAEIVRKPCKPAPEPTYPQLGDEPVGALIPAQMVRAQRRLR